MVSEKRLKIGMGYLLLGGIYLAIFLVALGGSIFLWQHHDATLQQILIPSISYNINILTIWNIQHLLSPIGLIELGMLILVGIQVARVALLLIYYIAKRDYWFILFSGFILSVILYSLIWQA